VTIVAWTGMRGAVSLAAALAIPLSTDAGAAFPHRELIIFLTFAVIVGTLLPQGLSLPALIRRLDVDDADEHLQAEENKARVRAAEAALVRIDELVEEEDWVREDTAERARGAYGYRQRRFGARFDASEDDPEEYEERSEQFQRLTRELIEAQRRQLQEMYSSGHLDDEVLRRIERELDLEDSRLEI
jgi:CPA1 family monovalent cation:H+ antiporter